MWPLLSFVQLIKIKIMEMQQWSKDREKMSLFLSVLMNNTDGTKQSWQLEVTSRLNRVIVRLKDTVSFISTRGRMMDVSSATQPFCCDRGTTKNPGTCQNPNYFRETTEQQLALRSIQKYMYFIACVGFGVFPVATANSHQTNVPPV